MIRPIRITIAGKMTPKGRPRATIMGRGAKAFVRIYTPKETEQFEERIKGIVGTHMLKNRLSRIVGPVAVEIRIEREIPASWSKKKRIEAAAGLIKPISVPDLDNEAKSLLDALNKVAYDDDNQVIDLRLSRRFSDTPQAHIVIRPVSPPPVSKHKPLDYLARLRRKRTEKGGKLANTD